MAKEAAEHIENRDKSLNKPSIVRRFCAGLIDPSFRVVFVNLFFHFS